MQMHSLVTTIFSNQREPSTPKHKQKLAGGRHQLSVGVTVQMVSLAWGPGRQLQAGGGVVPPLCGGTLDRYEDTSCVAEFILDYWRRHYLLDEQSKQNQSSSSS